MDKLTTEEGLKNEKTPRGLLIVFEGLDRSGKTTQSDKLANRLENSMRLRQKINKCWSNFIQFPKQRNQNRSTNKQTLEKGNRFEQRGNP